MSDLDVKESVGPGQMDAGTSLDRLEFEPDTESWTLEPPTDFRRAPFICSDRIDYSLASNGHTFTDSAFMQGRTAPVQLLRANDLAVVGGDGVVFYRGAPVYDTIFDLAPWELQSNLIGFETGRSLSFKNEVPVTRHYRDGHHFVGFNGRYTNYCHWIQQMHPWHTAFLSMREQFPGLKLVLPPFENGMFRYQTLRLLGIRDSEILVLRKNEAAVFSSAFFCSRFDLWTIPQYSVSAATRLASKVNSDSGRSDKIYIHRKVSRRRLANFTEHRAVLERHGFEIVEFEEASVKTQIDTLKHARYIIAEHGAGIINVMFCTPGARLIELFNPACVQPAFWSIASACGLDYGFLVGEHVETEEFPEPGWNSAYSISADRMAVAIGAVLAA